MAVEAAKRPRTAVEAPFVALADGVAAKRGWLHADRWLRRWRDALDGPLVAGPQIGSLRYWHRLIALKLSRGRGRDQQWNGD